MFQSAENLLKPKRGRNNLAFGIVNDSFENEDHQRESSSVQIQPQSSRIPVPQPRRNITRTADSKASSDLESASKQNTDSIQSESFRNASETTSEIPLTAFMVNEKTRKRITKPKKERDDTTSTIDENYSVESKLEDTKATKKKRRNIRTSASRDTIQDINRWKYEKIVGIYCHEVDRLKFTEDVKEPRIRISWFDFKSGAQMKKTDPKRDVIQENENCDYVPVVLTKGCKFRPIFSHLNCVWEELIVINEDIELMKNSSILFFEIIDLDLNREWMVLCWSFLKPFLENSFNNLDKRCRLQLFYNEPKKTLIHHSKNIGQLKKYPGTLEITVKGLVHEPTVDIVSDSRKINILQKETDLKPGSLNTPNDMFDVTTIWNNQYFKVPNTLVKSINLSAKGSNKVKFNFTGQLAAITEIQENVTYINLFTFPEIHLAIQLDGHSDIVYDLDWIKIEIFPQTLVSASADRSVIVWTIQQDFQYTAQVLPHFSFVYCAKFWIFKDQKYVVTAGRDSIIRIWDIALKLPKKTQELTRNDGFITCLAVSKVGNIYSGHNNGCVLEWVFTDCGFEYTQTVFQGLVMISCLEAHPRIDKLFIGNQCGVVHSVDIETHVILQTYFKGDQQQRKFFSFRLTSCGTYLITAFHRNATCWNVVTDSESSNFEFVQASGELSCVDVSPKGSFVIFTRYNSRFCVVLTGHKIEEAPAKTPPPLKQFKSISLDVQRKIAVKNKLSEIMQKLDDVFLLPRLCDDEKVSLTKDMQDEKRKIQDWLERNTSPGPDSDIEEGTFTIQRAEVNNESISSTDTFIVPKAGPPPKPKRLLKQQKQEPSDQSLDNTYDINPQGDSDTSISESILDDK